MLTEEAQHMLLGETGIFAGVKAAPAKGINGQPKDFEYVRLT